LLTDHTNPHIDGYLRESDVSREAGTGGEEQIDVGHRTTSSNGAIGEQPELVGTGAAGEHDRVHEARALRRLPRHRVVVLDNRAGWLFRVPMQGRVRATPQPKPTADESCDDTGDRTQDGQGRREALLRADQAAQHQHSLLRRQRERRAQDVRGHDRGPLRMSLRKRERGGGNLIASEVSAMIKINAA